MLPDDAKRFLQRFKVNEAKRQAIQDLIDDCYEYVMPLRNRVTSQGNSRRTENLFDTTAIEAAQDLASQVWGDIWPSNARPFDLVAGSQVPDRARAAADRVLAEVADDLIETANNSNLGAAAKAMLYDWQIGTGVMLVEEGDAVDPVRHTTVPLTECILGTGPRDEIDSFWRPLKPRLVDIETTWPDADLPAQLRGQVADAKRNASDTRADVIEGIERDWTSRGEEVWRFQTIMRAPVECVLVGGAWRGSGSCSVLWPSFERIGGEVLGRGPAQIALADIKTANEVKRLTLANAELAIAGLWQYEDDGVLNPDNVTLVPGTMIPFAQGSKGLQPLQSPGRFDVSQIILSDLQQAIRRMFFALDLGPTDQTPRSATEVLERRALRAGRMAGPTTNLLTEFLFPYVRRLKFIRQRQLGMQLPAIDGKAIAFIPRGPLTLAQSEEEVLRFNSTIELMQMRFGPQVTQLMVDAEAAAEWLAAKRGLPPKLIRDQVQRKQLAAAMAQAAAAAAQAGMLPQAGGA